MSCLPGKLQIIGINEIKGEKVFTLRFIQGRGPDWVAKSFFAKFDEEATWYTDLKPAFDEKNFFFQEELDNILKPKEIEIDIE